MWAGPRVAAEGVTGNLVWDSNLMGWEKDKDNEVSWLKSLPKEMNSRMERSLNLLDFRALAKEVSK